MLARFSGKHVLLLQGPMGPFFRRLARELCERNARVTKVNLNAGDALFFRDPFFRKQGEQCRAVGYRGSFEAWSDFVRDTIARERVAAVFLFGDCRPYHRAAVRAAKALGVDVYVFEEGYLRPDFVTIEKGGVNHYSGMPRNPNAYRGEVQRSPRTAKLGNTFWYSAFYTVLYALACTLFWWRYPRYRHHRNMNAVCQACCWLRSAARRWWYAFKERKVLPRLVHGHSKRYFLVPLQVQNDYQIKNSRFSDVEQFIVEVVESFARHAPSDHSLVFKHHPQDRAYRDYSRLMARLATEHGLGERLIYVHDLHLPTLLRHACGTVLVNSTVGLSALHHGTPVKLLDVAIYGFMGLVADVPLAKFWTNPPRVDRAAYWRCRRWLIAHNQANGSIWKRLPGAGPSGVFWPSATVIDSAPDSASGSRRRQPEDAGPLLTPDWADARSARG